jgi:antitoxin component YwqK of YwqJK toxin-antitoxin module|tara:strand:+ start:659 stop:3013 length:2355 start_codon:yes stop_codon:yes gene_type:complete
MKKGFWSGCLAFIIAKISHLIVTAAFGYVFGMIIGDKPILWDIIKIIDNPLFGIVFLIFATTFIYKKLTKNTKLTQYKTYHENSQLEKEGARKDGKQEGLWKYYHENGQLKSEGDWKDDGQEGLFKYYHKNGQLKEEINWKDGKPEGLCKYYHENGQLESERNFKDGKADGVCKTYHENGQLESEGDRKDGKQEGLWKTYHENGQLKEEVNFKDGELIEKDGNLNTKGSSNESDNKEALADFMLELSKLKNSLEKSPNLNKIFDEFTYAIRNGHTVREYLEQSDSFSAFETINILILGFTKIKDSIYKMLEKYEDSEFRVDFNALNEAIDILKKESKNNNNLFDQELEKINSQFELVLKSKNNEDYPPPFWYDIVKERAIYMEQDTNKKTLSEVQSEWVWMHADEYKNKYSSYSKNDIIDAMSLRIKRFGFIYKTMLSFENKLNALAKENNISSFSYLDQFKLEISSTYASLFGAINYALSIGMTNNDISKLYSDFVYNQDVINGADPFVNLGTTKEDARDIINDNLNINIDNIKTKQVKVKQKASKEKELKKINSWEDVDVTMAIINGKYRIKILQDLLGADHVTYTLQQDLRRIIILGRDSGNLIGGGAYDDYIKNMAAPNELREKEEKVLNEIYKETDLIKQNILIDNEIEKDPNLLELYNVKAYNLYELEKITEGIQSIMKAIETNPQRAGFYDTAGEGYYMLEDYRKAVDIMSAGIEIAPEGIDSAGICSPIEDHYYNRGQAYLKLKEYDKAKADFMHILLIDCTYEKAVRALNDLKMI